MMRTGTAPPEVDEARSVTAAMAVVLFASCLIVGWLIWGARNGYASFPIDSYFYLEMSRSLVREGNFEIRWQQGEPVHFFPGYPVLLAAVSLIRDPELTWPGLHVALTWSATLLLLLLLQRVSGSWLKSLAAATLFVTNAILLKWITLPAAELAAIVWLLISAHTWLAAGRYSAAADSAAPAVAGVWWAASGLAAAFAVLTRPDAAWWVLAVPLAHVVACRRLPALQRFMTWGISAAVPLAAYIVVRLSISSEAIPYISVLAQHEGEHFPGNTFFELLMKLIRQPNVIHGNPWINLSLIMLQLFLVAVLIVSARGYLQRGGGFLAWLVIGYLVAHSFWYYSTERFNILALPATSALLAYGLAWLLGPGVQTGKLLLQWLFVIVVSTFAGIQVMYGPELVKDHARTLAHAAGQPRQMATIAARKPGVAWVDSGLQFAYYYPGRTYVDADSPHFSRRTVSDPGEYFRNNDVRWLLTTRTLSEWLDTHAGVTTSTYSFTPRARDGLATLYEVERLTSR